MSDGWEKGRDPVEGHVEEEELLDLALGLCPPERAAGIMAHVRECPVCEEHLRERSRSVERARATAPVNRSSKPAGRLARPLRWMAPALLAAGVAFALLLPKLTGTSEESVWLPVEEAPALRSEGVSAALEAGVEAYRSRDADAAIAALERAREEGRLELIGRVLLASAYEIRGDPTRALTLLEEIDLLSIPQPWRDRARGIRDRARRALGHP